MVQQQAVPPLVVLTLTNRLVAMNAHTGQRAWEAEIRNLQGWLLVDQGVVIYVEHGKVFCLDYLTGAPRWTAQLPRAIAATSPIALMFAGCLVVSAMGEAVCFALQNGAQVWHDGFKGYGSGSGAMAAPGVAVQLDRHR